ncbi:cellulose binding domain-containing protein [Actinokineospora soli]|uniref:Cellulose binding domain-containing protein n=1 Tax=Actinokineospora soli TaxID=1048753 RepID=A0ABW2TZ70_9PSEU
MSWTFGSGERISQIWNATASATSGAVTARNVSYNGSLGAGAATTFGFLGAGTPGTPTATCSAG